MSEGLDVEPRTLAPDRIDEIRQWREGALGRIGVQPDVVQYRMLGLVRFDGTFTETSYVSHSSREQTVRIWQGTQTNRLTGNTRPVETINVQTYYPGDPEDDRTEKEDTEVSVDLSTGSVVCREFGIYVTPYVEQAHTDVVTALRGAGWGKMEQHEQA